MTGSEELDQLRSQFFALAYRMTGSVSEADDLCDGAGPDLALELHSFGSSAVT
jgi:DNA-directed RNA polymerase specialized sigma24 family protein